MLRRDTPVDGPDPVPCLDTGPDFPDRFASYAVCGAVGGHLVRRPIARRLSVLALWRCGGGALHDPIRPGRADVANARVLPLHAVRPPGRFDDASVMGSLKRWLPALPGESERMLRLVGENHRRS